METESKKAFSWEIDNFSERKGEMKSDPFSSGGCEWYISVLPNGTLVDDHLSLFLNVVNSGSLLPGWRRRAICRFVLLNQAGKELQIGTVEKDRLFCAETPAWGYHRMLPLTRLQEEGFLKNNKLTIEVYMKVVKVVDQGRLTENEMVDVCGFHVLNTQVVSVSNILIQHPEVAVGIKSGIREVKTAYMNILLGLIETLGKSPQSLSETELRNADSELSFLTEAGFKLDWLRSNLVEVLLKRKKASSDLKAELDKEKTKSATADHAPKAELEKENTKSATADADAPKAELEKEKTKSANADLKAELDKEKTKSATADHAPKAELEKEKTKSDTADADASKAELEKEETKSATADAPKAELEKENTKSVTVAAPKTELEKEKTKSDTAAAPRVSLFGCIDILVKRFFLSCFTEH